MDIVNKGVPMTGQAKFQLLRSQELNRQILNV